jgi:flavin reductase (DIM6/NTAB) family NADH-FMN oxidoreductase RutF
MEKTTTEFDGASVDPEVFRKAMGKFATGVTVVTTKTQEALHGMTVNSLTSVSTRPPLILVCLAEDTRTAKAVQARGMFVVNILQEQQADLSNTFARPREDHYARVEFYINHDDLPVLKGCLAHLVCRVERTVVAGDHTIVIAEVREAAFSQASPLVFFGRAYWRVAANAGQLAEDLVWYW